MLTFFHVTTFFSVFQMSFHSCVFFCVLRQYVVCLFSCQFTWLFNVYMTYVVVNNNCNFSDKMQDNVCYSQSHVNLHRHTTCFGIRWRTKSLSIRTKSYKSLLYHMNASCIWIKFLISYFRWVALWVFDVGWS